MGESPGCDLAQGGGRPRQGVCNLGSNVVAKPRQAGDATGKRWRNRAQDGGKRWQGGGNLGQGGSKVRATLAKVVASAVPPRASVAATTCSRPWQGWCQRGKGMLQPSARCVVRPRARWWQGLASFSANDVQGCGEPWQGAGDPGQGGGKGGATTGKSWCNHVRDRAKTWQGAGNPGQGAGNGGATAGNAPCCQGHGVMRTRASVGATTCRGVESPARCGQPSPRCGLPLVGAVNEGAYRG
jgi:hypothetical protein